MIESNSPSFVVLSIDEALDRIGYGPFQRSMLFAAGLCSASDAMEILVLRFLSASVQKEWNLTSLQSSTLISSVFVGAFVGTIILGRLGDVFGRRAIFIMTAAIVAIFGLLSAICPSYGYLLLCRTLVGVGIGGVTVPFDTYAECLPKDCRGKGLVVPSYFWTTGTILVILGAQVTVDNWRYLCLWCAIPCIVATIVGYMVVPESPHWLLTQSEKVSKGTELFEDIHPTNPDLHSNPQHDQALLILRHAAKLNGKDPNEIIPIGTRLSSSVETMVISTSTLASEFESESLHDQQTTTTRTPTTSVSNHLGSSLAILFIWFGYALLYYGTILVTTQVFTSNNNNNNDDDDNEREEENRGVSFDYSAILFASLAEVVATTFLLVTIEGWGRRILFAMAFGFGGIFIMALCRIQVSSSRTWDIGLAFMTRFWIFSGSSITWIWTAEVIETKHRTTGHGLANAGGRIGGFLAPYLISPTTVHSMGVILCLVSWILVGIAWTNLPETSGRPLGGDNGTMVQQQVELRPKRKMKQNEYQPISTAAATKSASSTILQKNS